LDANPKEKHPNLGNQRQAYKNPEWLGAPESRHIRIMYLGEALGLGSSSPGAVETALRCELYEPMQRLDAGNIDNYFIIATRCQKRAWGFPVLSVPVLV